MDPGPELLVHSSFDDTAVRRACVRGDLVRVAAGRYVRAEHWSALSAGQQDLMRAIAAATRLAAPVVLSHVSAAAAWGLPRLGPWPARVDVVDPRLERSTAGRTALTHAAILDAGDVVERHGVLVTSAARTAVDLARTLSFRQAVVALDHGLRVGLFTQDELLKRVDALPVRRGQVRARAAIEFADGRADRAGESLSRVVMLEAGLEPPELQKRFTSRRGAHAFVDFWWPEQGLVGEFDGFTKYRDAEMRAGRTAEQVVVDEKLREDWIRALPEVRGFVRWVWRDTFDSVALAARLSAAGVPLRARRPAAARRPAP